MGSSPIAGSSKRPGQSGSGLGILLIFNRLLTTLLTRRGRSRRGLIPVQRISPVKINGLGEPISHPSSMIVDHIGISTGSDHRQHDLDVPRRHEQACR